MSEAYLIEAAGLAAGIVVRETSGFRFFASAPQFSAIEQRLFRRAADAERAARSLAAAVDTPHFRSWR